MTDLTATAVYAVSDAAGRDLGTVAVDRVEGELVGGEFTPGPDYPAVEATFNSYSDVVEQQSFSFLDEVEAAVARLGITVRGADGRPIPVSDVQIYRDGAASFRLPDPGGRTGRP